MLPRLVGGADESLNNVPRPSRLPVEFQPQPANVSCPLEVPLAVGGGGVVGRDRGCPCEALCSE